MKSIINSSLKNLLIIVLSCCILQNSFQIKKERSLIESINESFLEKKTNELSENFNQEEELEYAVPSTNSTGPAVMSAEGWLKISSEEFRNENKFPPLEVAGKKFRVKTDRRNFRLNYIFDSKKQGADLPKTNTDFYFRLVRNLIYYTVSKKDVNMIGTIDVASIKPISMFLPGIESDALCFQVTDQENINWDICAGDKKTADDWICKIRTVLGISCKVEYNNNKNTTELNGTQVYQPIIVVPIPAKECNQNWDYQVKGNDWECGCREGMEQSPINIPSIENVIESPVKPIFTFNPISAKSPVSSIDGELKTQEYIKIKYFKNAIRILHHDFGKIVTLDGSVYIGEEIVFHTPAEHKINGRKFDMEMQVIYYGRSKGDIAKQVVLSFLFEKRAGVYNKFLEDLDIFALPSENAPERDIKNDIYIPRIFYNSDEESDLTMKPFSFYTYQGSLSMPPCSEGTIHYVAADVIPLGSVPIQLFREALKKSDNPHEALPKNARSTQPLNGRKVFFYDKDKYDTDVVPQKRELPIEGHYEKIHKHKTQYLWVNNNQPSLLPGAVLVPKKEVSERLGVNNEDV